MFQFVLFCFSLVKKSIDQHHSMFDVRYSIDLILDRLKMITSINHHFFFFFFWNESNQMKQRDHCCCLLSHSTMKQSFQQCSNMLLSNIPKLNFSQLFNNYDCYIVRFTLLCSIVFFLDRKRKENFFFFGPELIDNEHIVWFVQTQKDISFSSQFVVGNEEKKIKTSKRSK